MSLRTVRKLSRSRGRQGWGHGGGIEGWGKAERGGRGPNAGARMEGSFSRQTCGQSVRSPSVSQAGEVAVQACTVGTSVGSTSAYPSQCQAG